MRKLILPIFLILSGLILSGCTLPGQSDKFSALQISSLPRATVFFDNKHVGRTPFYDEKLKPGEYILKLVPESGENQSASWTGKVKLSPETLTVINWQFGSSNEKSEGETLSLEKVGGSKAEVAIITTPDQAQIKIDSLDKGAAPLILKDLPGGDHEIVLAKEGYNQRTIRAKTINDYRLTINAQLSKLETGTPSATKEDKNAISSESATLVKKIAVIKDTPTGWLRVREEASLVASESGKVNPGQEFPYLEEKEGWIKIEYQKGKFGWVSSQYVEKKEQ